MSQTSIPAARLGTAIDPERLVVEVEVREEELVSGTARAEPVAQPLPSHRRVAALRGAHLGLVGVGEDVIHYGVAIVLMIVAAVVLFHTAYDLFTTHQAFAQAATTAVNGVLFAIIIMEVMRTVLAHFDRGGLQLQPFLIIGIISAVREILSVGAHLSLESGARDGTASTVHLALLELGVNGGVVVGLAAALVLIRRLAGMRDGRGG